MNLSRRNLFLGSLSLVAGSFVPKFLKRGIKEGDKVAFKGSCSYLGPGILSIENKTHPLLKKNAIWIATVTHNSHSWTCFGESSLEKLTSLINEGLQLA